MSGKWQVFGRGAALSLACVATLTFASCGKDSKPANPTGPVTTPSTAPPPATPPPATPPPPPPGSAFTSSCKALTASNGSDRDCRQEAGRVYEGALAKAVASVRPDALDGNEVVYVGGYLEDIVTALDKDGICAVVEGDNLFMRGVGDGFNEYYDILTSKGGASQRYTNTCRPAVTTPQPRPAPPQRDPTCKLPPSQETICFEDVAPLFDEEMRVAIDQVIAEDRARATPLIFDFDRLLPGSNDGYKINDATRYHEAVVEKLQKQGFCAYYDGEDIQVKNSNRQSSHWDIYKAEGFKIRLFTAVCRDAAF